MEARDFPNTTRFVELENRHQQVFGQKPFFIARAPGRVNLIGEHVDYSGYSVLPMAIEGDALIGVSQSSESLESAVVLENIESKFLPRSEPIQVSHLIDDHSVFSQHHWSNYFLAACQGLVRHAKEYGIAHDVAQLFRDLVSKGTVQLTIWGTVPIGSGLSSSSSMVCSFTLAVAELFVRQKLIEGALASREDLAAICAKSERFIGVESGGMDQAISFLAQQNYAMRIEFHPKLTASKVQLPSSALFVICNSLVEHSLQSAASGSGYNVRVVECRLAAAVLGHHLNLPVEKIRTLLDFELLAIPNASSSCVDLDRCLEWTAELLHEEPYTIAELETLLGADTFQAYLGCVRDPLILNNLRLKQRARHVFSEAKRVISFQQLANQLCSSNDVSQENLQRLGTLMNESHESCKTDFECSCPELDAIVSQCRSAGAVGARLTGAGWGGWCISMIPVTIREEFLENLASFYSSRSNLPLNLLLLESTPSDGACVFASSTIH